MARSIDIQNDINHLQAQADSENNAMQQVDAQIRSLTTKVNDHRNHIVNFQNQIKNKQRDLQVAANAERKEAEDLQRQANQAMQQARGMAA